MAFLGPDTKTLTPEEAAKLGYRFDPTKRVWVNSKGEQYGIIPQSDPSKFVTSDIGAKQILSGAGLFLGGGLLADAALGGSAAGASPGLTSGAAGTTTGGTTAAGSSFASKLPKLIADVAPAVTALNTGRAQGRAAEDAANIVYDANNVRRSESAQDNYQRNLSNALRGGLLQGVQDVNVSSPAGIPRGNVTGGLRPSAIVGREDIGKRLQDQANRNLLGMDEGGDTDTPDLSPRPSAGKFDSVLGTLAPLLSITDLLTDNASRSQVMPKPSTGVTFKNAGMNGVQLLPPRY